MKWVSLLILGLLMTTPPVQAQTGRTGFAILYDNCLSNRGSNTAFMAWVPGTFIWCYHAKVDPAKGLSEVLKRCNDGFKKQYRVRGIACQPLYDGEKLVDRTLLRLRGARPPIPMQIGIFDAETGKLQRTSGVYRELPPVGDRTFDDPTPYVIEAKGIEICSGTFQQAPDRRNAFTAECFDTSFQGLSRPEKFVLTDGFYTPVPKVVRMSSGESWIEFRF